MAHRLDVHEILEAEGYEDVTELLEEVIFDSRHCPAMCSEGCEVEVDGHCSHGFPSLALAMGIV